MFAHDNKYTTFTLQMVKLLGIENKNFENSSIEEIYGYFSEKESVQFDSETMGFDAHTKALMCVQLGDTDNQFVVSPDLLHHFKDLLEGKTLLMHNAKFDLKFLYKNDIWPRKIYDTFLAESVLTCGLQQAKRTLAAVAKKRLEVSLDKSVRDSIWNEGLTTRVLQYAADDVKYLESIRDHQLEDIKRLGLEGAVEQENQFVLALAYIEFSGLKLNVKAWKAKCDQDLVNLIAAKAKLDNFIVENDIDDFISPQLDLFSPVQAITINWASSKQVIKLFKQLKIPVSIIEKGVERESVEYKYINKYAKKYPIVEDYLHYKECEKLVTTYGVNFIKQINPATGRLHTNFKQLMDTGRTSSGGKNRDTKEAYLNFQNIPSDDKTRACFIADEGNLLVVSDYSGQEQVVLANKTLDKNLLEFYDRGLADMHSFVASKMYPELEDLSIEDIKRDHKDKRQSAKIAGFIISYGGSPKNIAEQLDQTEEQGQITFNAYFKAFPDMRVSFEKAKKEGLEKGYILISEKTGRKSFIDGYEEFMELKREINEGFWERWKKVKKDPSSEKYKLYKDKISKYFKIRGAIERKSLNFPIQGVAAEISKLAGIKFFEWIRENKLLNQVLIVNYIHDEILAECPQLFAGVVATSLQRCMEEAGAEYCKRVKLKAEPVITTVWNK